MEIDSQTSGFGIIINKLHNGQKIANFRITDQKNAVHTLTKTLWENQ
jgi:hypothetical protein